jgi:hypothetical protein
VHDPEFIGGAYILGNRRLERTPKEIVGAHEKLRGCELLQRCNHRLYTTWRAQEKANHKVVCYLLFTPVLNMLSITYQQYCDVVTQIAVYPASIARI